MNKDELDPADGWEMRYHPRQTEEVPLPIPVDTLQALRTVAERRQMSVQGLLKLYIGHGLRQDLSALFGDQVLDSTAQVLARHVESKEEVAAILDEIRSEVLAAKRLKPER